MGITLAWFVLFLILIIIEALTLGLTTIWFAFGSLVAAIVSGVGGGLHLQIILFIAVSVIVLLTVRPIAVKHFNNRVHETRLSVIGKKGVVTETIDNINAAGTVVVDGEEWTARNAENDLKIITGTVVSVVDIQGVKLMVELDKKEKQEK